jgi:hypothetical protein
MIKFCLIVTALASLRALSADLPPEVAQVVDARATSLAEVEKAYRRELDELLQKYKTTGDSSKAAIVAKLIEEAGKKPATAVEPEDKEGEGVIGKIIGTWKRDTDSTLWVFNDSKTGTFKGSEPFSFSYDAKKKEIRIVSGKWVDEMSYNGNTDTLRGTDANGKKYKLTRVK